MKTVRYATKTRCAWFYDQIYFMNYYVLFNDKHINGLKRQFLRDRDAELDMEGFADMKSAAITSIRDGISNCIFFRFAENQIIGVDMIAHESVHAASFAFESRGVDYDFNNDEAWAYYIGFLAWNLHEIIEQWSIDRKKK